MEKSRWKAQNKPAQTPPLPAICWVINNILLESSEPQRGGDLASPSVLRTMNCLSEDAHKIMGEALEFISQKGQSILTNMKGFL